MRKKTNAKPVCICDMCSDNKKSSKNVNLSTH